jgi:hypothetical protein
LGDAAGDTLTINGTNISIPNNLNFDANTLFINASTNNVGIGTTVPSRKLDVAGGIELSSVSDQKLAWGITGSYLNWIECGGGAGTTYMRFATGNSEALRIDAAGNVGIGIGSPTGRLAVLTNTAVTAYAQTWEIYNGAAFQLTNVLGGDSTNGAYFGPFQNVPLRFITNNSERMRIDAAGNVGIGKDIPSVNGKFVVLSTGTPTTAYASVLSGVGSYNSAWESTLYLGLQRTDVVNNGAVVGYRIKNYGANAAGSYLAIESASSATGAAAPPTTFTERMRIDASGNVGIGISTPVGKLNIGDGDLRLTQTAGGDASGVNSYSMYFRTPSGDLAQLYCTTEGGGGPSGFGGALRIFTKPNNGALIERMRIDSSGNVSVSSDAGNTLRYFDVANGNTGSSAGSIIRLITSNAAGTTSTSVDIVKYKFGALTINNNESNSAAYTSFGVGASERMRITSAGDLLVGTTSSGGRVSIQGSGNTSATKSFSIINSAGSNCIYVRDDRQIFADGISSGAGTYPLKWQASGQFTYDTSSARYKDNIRDSRYGLSEVLNLRSTIFEYKDNGRTDIGLIAEEVLPVIPELVILDKQGRPDAVSYDRFVSVLVKAIQELHAEIESLKQRTH